MGSLDGSFWFSCPLIGSGRCVRILKKLESHNKELVCLDTGFVPIFGVNSKSLYGFGSWFANFNDIESDCLFFEHTRESQHLIVVDFFEYDAGTVGRLRDRKGLGYSCEFHPIPNLRCGGSDTVHISLCEKVARFESKGCSLTLQVSASVPFGSILPAVLDVVGARH